MTKDFKFSNWLFYFYCVSYTVAKLQFNIAKFLLCQNLHIPLNTKLYLYTSQSVSENTHILYKIFLNFIYIVANFHTIIYKSFVAQFYLQIITQLKL